MRLGQKGFAHILILSSIIIILGGFAWWLLSNKANNPTENNSSSENTQNQHVTTGWDSFKDNEFGLSFKYPPEWIAGDPRTAEDTTLLIFQDPRVRYDFSLTKHPNYNNETEKKYSNIKDYLKLNSDLATSMIDGQKAYHALPRAGSENANAVFFFSKDKEYIYEINLTTNSEEPKDINAGQELFTQIISTVEFTD